MSSCINVRTILVTAFVCLMLSFQNIHAADIEYIFRISEVPLLLLYASDRHRGSLHVLPHPPLQVRPGIASHFTR